MRGGIVHERLRSCKNDTSDVFTSEKSGEKKHFVQIKLPAAFANFMP